MFAFGVGRGGVSLLGVCVEGWGILELDMAVFLLFGVFFVIVGFKWIEEWVF